MELHFWLRFVCYFHNEAETLAFLVNITAQIQLGTLLGNLAFGEYGQVFGAQHQIAPALVNTARNVLSKMTTSPISDQFST